MIYVIYVHGWHIKMDHLRFHLSQVQRLLDRGADPEVPILTIGSWGQSLVVFPMENRGKPMGKPWKTHGKASGIPHKTGNLVLLCSTSDLKTRSER